MLTLLLLSLSSLFLNFMVTWPAMIFILVLTLFYSFKLMLCNFSSLHYCSNMFYIDNMSMVLIMLTLWISMLMLLSSFNSINPKKDSFFLPIIIVLMISLILCFSLNKTIFFYIMFEASLIPTLILILTWGYQPERIQASSYMIMYTVVASLPLLLIFVWMKTITFHMNFSIQISLPPSSSWLHSIMWCFMILAFLVKLPLFFLHLWLPKAHVEAPLAGSMILAAILLKLGGFGVMRLSFMLPSMNKFIQNYLSSISLFGALMASMICTRQTDMKALIAYSSVSHMGMFLVGVLSHSSSGWNGALLMMIAHGFSSSLLFCLASMTYNFSSSRSLILSKGLLEYTPIFSMFWFLGAMMSMAAPPTLNLPSEILLATSIISMSSIMIPFIMLILFLSALYTLILYTNNNHGVSILYSNPSSCLSSQMKMTLILHMVPGFSLIFSMPLFMIF